MHGAESRSGVSPLWPTAGQAGASVDLRAFSFAVEGANVYWQAPVEKFGDSVMSKTDTAMVNEVLCKLLCHNLTCLIQEQETLGIAPVFWKDEEAEVIDAEVLPIRRLAPTSGF